MQDETKKKAKPKTGPKSAVKTPVDPIEILEQIAGNRRLKPTPRVAAARELLKFRLALLGAQKQQPAAKTDEARQAGKSDRLADELNRRALSAMNAKGSA